MYLLRAPEVKRNIQYKMRLNSKFTLTLRHVQEGKKDERRNADQRKALPASMIGREGLYADIGISACGPWKAPSHDPFPATALS
jgi:hypothetical protein